MFASLSGAFAGVTVVEEAGAAFDDIGAAIAPVVSLGVLSDFLQPIAAMSTAAARRADAWVPGLIMCASWVVVDESNMARNTRDLRRATIASIIICTLFSALSIPRQRLRPQAPGCAEVDGMRATRTASPHV